MGEFKTFDGGESFFKPDKPFLLIMESKDGEIVNYWYETEDELIHDKIELERVHNLHLVDAIEIGSCRDVIFENVN